MSGFELRFSWRSWVRVGVSALLGLILGVVALTPDAPWWVRVVFGLVAALNLYLTVDALIFARSWRLSDRALHLPTLASRKREVSGDTLAVELTSGRRPVVRVSGPRGSRLIGPNPLVAGRDLRTWFDGIPAD